VHIQALKKVLSADSSRVGPEALTLKLGVANEASGDAVSMAEIDLEDSARPDMAPVEGLNRPNDLVTVVPLLVEKLLLHQPVHWVLDEQVTGDGIVVEPDQIVLKVFDMIQGDKPHEIAFQSVSHALAYTGATPGALATTPPAPKGEFVILPLKVRGQNANRKS
jgi:hypothetical protein